MPIGLNFLPIEILTIISRHLSFSDRKSFSFANIRFYQSTYHRDLWENIIFVIGKSTPLTHLNPHFLSILTNIKLFSVDIDPSQLSDLLTHTHNLSHLDLIICPNLFREPAQLILHFLDSISPPVRNVLANLRSLNVSGNKATLTDVSLNCLLAHCRSLHTIDLSDLEIDSLPKIGITELIDNKYRSGSIQNLPPNIDRLTFANIISKFQSISHSLTCIKLCSTAVGYDDLFALATVPDLRLINIGLDNCKNIDLKTIRMIVELHSASLQEISAINTVPVAMGTFLGLIGGAKRLRTARARGNGQTVLRALSDASLFDVGSLMRHLHLEGCAIDDRFIGCVNRLRLVEKLHLVGCDFSAVGNSGLRLDSLRELSLCRSYGFRCERLLQSIFYASRLRRLWLDWVKIDDSLIGAHNGLIGLAELQTLSLIGCAGVTARVLARCLGGLPQLRALCLQGVTDIEDDFLAQIGCVCKALRELNLSGSRVSDAALLKCVGELFQLRKLRLDNCCNITENLVSALPVMCPFLQDVSMRNCDHIAEPIALNYFDSMFLYEWQMRNGCN